MLSNRCSTESSDTHKKIASGNKKGETFPKTLSLFFTLAIQSTIFILLSIKAWKRRKAKREARKPFKTHTARITRSFHLAIHSTIQVKSIRFLFQFFSRNSMPFSLKNIYIFLFTAFLTCFLIFFSVYFLFIICCFALAFFIQSRIIKTTIIIII